MAQELCHLSNVVWNSKTVPDEWTNRLKDNLEKRLRREQAVFGSGRSYSGQILTLIEHH